LQSMVGSVSGEMPQSDRTFIIAEAGVNHNGELEKALALVDLAAEAGADAVKFQTFSADRLIRSGAKKAAYQERNTGPGDQHSMLKALEMSEVFHRAVQERCVARNVEFMSTPFDEEALDLLIGLGVKRLKSASGELTNHPLLERMAAAELPMIVSTGMADLEEVRQAVEVIARATNPAGQGATSRIPVTLLHCTSDYPTRFEDVNLRAMTTLAKEFNLPVGYSDHTPGIEVSLAAVALGARVIEKHFTLDKELPGPDHAASLAPAELKALVSGIRKVEASLGKAEKHPTPDELKTRELVRKSVTALRTIPSGKTIEVSDIGLMRPGTGIPPAHHGDVVGRIAARDIDAGETLDWSDVK
jgi:N,N'-diacetyllegionaminate synthase